MPSSLIAVAALGCIVVAGSAAAAKDAPFKQDSSFKFSLATSLGAARFDKIVLNQSGIAYVLTDRGVARVFEGALALDRSFRPLASRRPTDLANYRGQVFYLYPDELLSNDEAGKMRVSLPPARFDRLAVAEDGTVLLTGPLELALVKAGQVMPIPSTSTNAIKRVASWQNEFFILDESAVRRVSAGRVAAFHRAPDATAVAFRGRDMIVGTTNGYYSVNLDTGRPSSARQNRLPCPDITCLLPVPDGLWVGTPRGAFYKSRDGFTDYYASKRWLSSDHVIDLRVEPGGDLLVLTTNGLNRIQFRMMTLAEKAAHYDRKIRQRHIRFGFCSELRLLAPGDITSAEMIDTDNDGTWSNYYMASQAFRFGATGSEEARRNAWETFEALERLEVISGIHGFPARTFERQGFRFSDPDRWQTTTDGHWEWKRTTSSDEITAHMFGCAVMWETVARNAGDKARLARFFDRIISHILRNNLYLVDTDGKPTLWGRWNPEYVNWYPPTIGDRRLNSAEIIAMLQFAYRITGTELYQEKALELIRDHGYLDNIVSSMRTIRHTPGFVHQGNEMGTEWNHSDDLLSFVTYWVLHRFALNGELRARYAAAIRDHWEIERSERCPLWNFVYAATHASHFDLQEALWTLRRYPLDLIGWTVSNSYRNDLTRLPDNFRRQQTAELLPPSERAIMRWNGNPYILDGGSGGGHELAGDEFLLPYWMARYLKILE